MSFVSEPACSKTKEVFDASFADTATPIIEKTTFAQKINAENVVCFSVILFFKLSPRTSYAICGGSILHTNMIPYFFHLFNKPGAFS